MATITTTKLPTFLAPASFKKTTRIHSTPILGLPVMARTGCKVKCSLEEKKEARSKGISTSMVLSMMAAASAMATSTAGPATALVDERMSTEGTGLPFGLSNNLLVWILLGVFGLIWAFYSVYTSTLEEDDDSALSL
ncbi:photosystem II reaction center W protein, chloroplastic [Hevea brasiliensis]|uniref:photosystem II reaction center W protein, chloroplastic n=1 Tax=Hevea brasiliensis TaxID=3981 RepID=UPI0025F00112|nr:photosystem II reaction center W protein, chloroplastic [Hevea brasiliensis]